MRILIATDAFPPICGGSGWSTYELARGLRARGHDVIIVRPRVGAERRTAVVAGESYDGFTPVEFHDWAPRVPFIRNYFKNERLYSRLARFLERLVRERSVDIVHAQHLMTGPASIVAGRHAGVPVVCTIRDYWPVCYWSDLILDRRESALCPGCSAARMTRCVRPHAGAAWPLALPAIPYMRANLARKQVRLAEADTVIAVSTAIARDLVARAPALEHTRIEVVHNPVDVTGLRQQAASTSPPLSAKYALFVGKLEVNKGVSGLAGALRRAGLQWPLVVVGDGAERPRLEAEVRAAGVEARFTGWLERPEVVRWLQHASMLVFPSYGPESLSRVLIEASALGVPIAAMETGGTADIVVHEETGLLSHSFDELGDAVARLANDAVLAERLGGAARRRARERFSADAVVSQIEAVYRRVVADHDANRAH